MKLETNYKTVCYRILLLCCLWCGVAPALKAQQLAVKTNALMWAAMMPNAECEVVVGERTSVGLSLFGSTSIYGHEAKIIGLQPEYRYWFNGRPMTREFIGVSLLGASYDITWGRHIYQGDAAGAGVTMGYVMYLGKRWNLEFYGGFGAVFFKQKQYYVDDNYADYTDSQATHTNADGYKLLPPKVGISISYIFR